MTEEDEGIHHYEYGSEVPAHIRKYWQQRYQIFSNYDEGIWMTDDAWFGVTPEPVANMIAKHVAEAAPAGKTILIDAFAGAGGNTIAFALSGRWDRIFAIEKDPQVLRCAKHNAEIYGASKKVWWIQGDCFEVIKKRLAGMGNDAVVFASPPWGGPGYSSDEIFNLMTMQPYNLRDLCVPILKFTKELVLYLPRTSNLNQLAAYATGSKRMRVTHYCMHGASKALCAYLGDFNFSDQ